MSTVGKAVSLLKMFTAIEPEIGLSELARAAGFDKATTRRLLVSLADHGLIEQDAISRRYRLGAGLSRLARIRDVHFPFVQVAEPITRELAAETGETVHLSEFSAGALLTVHVELSARANRVNVDVGQVLPLHGTASGLICLAFSRPDVLERHFQAPLAAYTQHTITNRDKVMDAVRLLNFRPNGNAASLRSRKSKLVGLVVPSLSNAFFARMASEFERLAFAHGYEIAVIISDEDVAIERDRILTLLSRQLEGLIVYPASDESVGGGLDPQALPPTVVMDRGLGIAGVDSVGLKNEEAGRLVARELLSLGHRRIGVLLPTIDLAASRDRVTGISTELEQAGGDAECRVVLGGHTIDGARSAIEQELLRVAGKQRGVMGDVGAVILHQDKAQRLEIDPFLAAGQSQCPVQHQPRAAADQADLSHALRAALDSRKANIKVVFAGSSEVTLRRMFGRAREPFYNWAALEPFELLGREFVQSMVTKVNRLSRFPLNLEDALHAYEALHRMIETYKETDTRAARSLGSGGAA